MEKSHFDNKKFETSVDTQVQQLLRIARLELERPLEACKTLVFGSSNNATRLYEELEQQGVVAKIALSVAQLQEEDERFDLAIILEPISHRVLENLMAVGGVAIDANSQRSGEWVMHDKSLKFKRIRVLSMIGK